MRSHVTGSCSGPCISDDQCGLSPLRLLLLELLLLLLLAGTCAASGRTSDLNILTAAIQASWCEVR